MWCPNVIRQQDLCGCVWWFNNWKLLNSWSCCSTEIILSFWLFHELLYRDKNNLHTSSSSNRFSHNGTVTDTLAVMNASRRCPRAIYLLTSAAQADHGIASAAAASSSHADLSPWLHARVHSANFRYILEQTAASSNQVDIIRLGSHRLSAFTCRRLAARHKWQRPVFFTAASVYIVL